MENNESKPTAKTTTKRGRKPKKIVEGLGDAIELVTETTGIKAVVDWFSEQTGIDCGCDARKEKLNKLFRFKKPECLTSEEYDYLHGFFGQPIDKISPADQRAIATIHSRVFKHKFIVPCTCSPTKWKEWLTDLKTIYNEYKVAE